MANQGFAVKIGEWTRQVKTCNELVFRESVLELVRVLDMTVPVETGFLRASLAASNVAIPLANLSRPEGALFTSNLNEVEFVIRHMNTDDKLYLGYRAEYWAYVHYGANGRPGRPWIALAAQRWPGIVSAKAAMVKSRLGL